MDPQLVLKWYTLKSAESVSPSNIEQSVIYAPKQYNPSY